MHDHVSADPAGLGAAAVQDAVKDAHHREDHHDLNGDGKNADDGAERAVYEIAEDQFVHRRRRWNIFEHFRAVLVAVIKCRGMPRG
jgi:hypothetical protein